MGLRFGDARGRLVSEKRVMLVGGFVGVVG